VHPSEMREMLEGRPAARRRLRPQGLLVAALDDGAGGAGLRLEPAENAVAMCCGALDDFDNLPFD